MADNRQDYKIEWARNSGYKYQKEWNKRNIKMISVNLNKSNPDDAEIIEFWDSLKNKAQAFREMVRNYMAKQN